jgi:hypothetical protein
LIVASISFCVIDLFRWLISSWFSFGWSYISDRSQSELSHQESLAKGSLVCYGLLWVEKFPLFVYLEPLSATGSFTTCHVSRIFLASQGPQFVTRDKVWLNLWVPTKWVTEVDRTLSRLHAEVYMRSQTNILAGFIASIHVQEFTSLLG